MKPSVLVLLLFVIFAAAGVSHASSVYASFNVINSNISINQNTYFNISADFPTQTNYTIFLNKTAIEYGSIPANSSKYYVVEYNVSNIPYGTYTPMIKFYAFNLSLKSSQQLYVKSFSNFIFEGEQTTTQILDNYSLINIEIKNVGNTPLYMNWSLPAFRNISISLDFQQNFNLLPGTNKTIPINLSVGKGYQSDISFGFTGKYNNYSETKYYQTTLIKPYVNMSFYNENVTQINSTRQLFIMTVKDYNNVPVTLILKFTLNVNGSTVYYTKSYLLPVNASKIEVYLPKSTIENVQASYQNSNLSQVTESIFAAPKQPFKVSIDYIINTLGYAIFTLLAVFLLIAIHIKFRKRGQHKKDGNNK